MSLVQTPTVAKSEERLNVLCLTLELKLYTVAPYLPRNHFLLQNYFFFLMDSSVGLQL